MQDFTDYILLLCGNLRLIHKAMKTLVKYYLYGIAIIFLVVVVLLSNKYYSEEFYENVLVELHGVIIETLIIGFIISIWAKRKERNSKIELLEEQILLYKAWKSEESSFRIFNLHNSLRKYGIVSDLSNSSFINLKMSDFGYHLDLRNSEFSNSSLIHCDLRYASFKSSKITNTHFINCDLRGVNLFWAKISNSSFYQSSFNSTIIDSITFENVHFEYVDFERAYFINVNFVSCTFSNVKFNNTFSYKSNINDYINQEGIMTIDNQSFNHEPFNHEPTRNWIINMTNNLKLKSKITKHLQDYLENDDDNYI
jgi:uncharacterized protein YjbI with pentapeptide repeats